MVNVISLFLILNVLTVISCNHCQKLKQSALDKEK